MDTGDELYKGKGTTFLHELKHFHFESIGNTGLNSPAFVFPLKGILFMHQPFLLFVTVLPSSVHKKHSLKKHHYIIHHTASNIKEHVQVKSVFLNCATLSSWFYDSSGTHGGTGSNHCPDLNSDTSHLVMCSYQHKARKGGSQRGVMPSPLHH